MGVIYIAELNAIGGGGNHPISGAQWPPVVEQTVTIGGASSTSNVFNKNTTLLRINVDSVCSIVIGLNPTATVVNARMAANQTEYFSVPPNSKWQLAVIANV
jgi:hypothetical protein